MLIKLKECLLNCNGNNCGRRNALAIIQLFKGQLTKAEAYLPYGRYNVDNGRKIARGRCLMTIAPGSKNEIMRPQVHSGIKGSGYDPEPPVLNN